MLILFGVLDELFNRVIYYIALWPILKKIYSFDKKILIKNNSSFDKKNGVLVKKWTFGKKNGVLILKNGVWIKQN